MSTIYKQTIEIDSDDLVESMPLDVFKDFVRQYVTAFDTQTQQDIIKESFELDENDYLELVSDYKMRQFFNNNKDYYLEDVDIEEYINDQNETIFPDLEKKEEVRRFLIRMFTQTQSYQQSNADILSAIAQYLDV